MKKIILSAVSILSLSIAVFAGCGTTADAGNKISPDTSRNLVQEDDCKDGDCENNGNEENFDIVQPIPRTPHTDRRTTETEDDGNINDGSEKGDSEHGGEHKHPHRRHRHPKRRGNENIPMPRPAPVMPK